VSGHTIRYHALRVPPALGALNVCMIELSPLVGDVPPTRAENVPEWLTPDTTATVPAPVQPARVPVSKPPLVIPLPLDALTTKETVVLCVALAPVPVTVMV